MKRGMSGLIKRGISGSRLSGTSAAPNQGKSESRRQGKSGSLKRGMSGSLKRGVSGSLRRQNSSFLHLTNDLTQAVQRMSANQDDESNWNDADEENDANDIARKFNILLKQVCKENRTTVAAVEAPLDAWRREHLANIENAVVLSFFEDALPSLMAQFAQFEQTRQVQRKRNVFTTVLLTSFDTLSDYGVIAVLYHSSNFAVPMIVVLFVSFVVQAGTVYYATREGFAVTVGALLGLKPLIDCFNIAFEIDRQPGAITATTAFAYTRMIQSSTEAIPLAIIQALALMKHRSIAQWVSFAITVVNIAFSVVSVDYQIDTNAYYQKIEPLVYGCYKHGLRGDTLFVLVAFFSFGYVAAKLLAVAMLGTVSGSSLAMVFIGESLVLFLMRCAVGNWRFYSAVGDSALYSIVCHFLAMYPCMMAAPVPVLRHPFGLSPAIYSGFEAWTLFAANPLMIALTFHYGAPSGISPQVVWMLLGGATLFSAISFLLAFLLMDPATQITFYRHRTMATHLRNFHWGRIDKVSDGHLLAGNHELDTERAILVAHHAIAYWPTDLVRAWVLSGWPRWLQQQPEWFTEDWRARVAEVIFPDGGHGDGRRGSTVIPMTRQEQYFRRVLGRTSPWDLGARELEEYLEQHFVEQENKDKNKTKSYSVRTSWSEKMKRRQVVHQIVGEGGVGILEHCCTSIEQPPWVQLTYASSRDLLQADKGRVKLLTETLCDRGLAFYFQLYVASTSHSPLHEYEFFCSEQRRADYEMMLVRDRQTKQLKVLTVTSFDRLELTQMASENKTLSDIQKTCDESEFVASVHQWGASGPTIFIIGEYCEGEKKLIVSAITKTIPCSANEHSSELY